MTIRIQKVGGVGADGLDERVAAVAVRIDQARQDRLALAVDRLRGLILLADLVGRANGHDPPAVDGDGAVQEHATVGVDGDHRAAGQQQVNHECSA